MKRIILIFSIFLVGLVTREFFPNQFTPKYTEVTKEATSTATLVATNSATVRVSRVVDGDTIELETGKKVRYIGIDAPETVDPRRPVACFGKEASAKNKALVEGKMVRLEKDISETDKYGRLLRYVYVGDTLVNESLVREGFAHASTYPPDVKFSKLFVGAESEAREFSRGLWAGCP